VGAALAFSAVGCWDDLVKATARPGRGLKARHKIALQAVLALVAGWLLIGPGGCAGALHLPPSFEPLPLGWAYLPVAVIIIIATANAANIADGLDGLAAGLLGQSYLTIGVIAAIEGRADISAFCAAAAAACAAFLWFNWHPARIWMGDTGSLGLGAGLAVAALAAGKTLLLPLVGIVLVLDATSVIVQVLAFQTTGRRVFRIAPIHHAFELRGWSEPRVVAAAWLLNGVGCCVAGTVWFCGQTG
jgi:phospho-N-acetylmuramoyl-pentapeptide-transferase